LMIITERRAGEGPVRVRGDRKGRSAHEFRSRPHAPPPMDRSRTALALARAITDGGGEDCPRARTFPAWRRKDPRRPRGSRIRGLLEVGGGGGLVEAAEGDALVDRLEG